MLPSTLLGLAIVAVSLSPGFLFITKTERHRSRRERSQLGELVEMTTIGSLCSLVAALIVVAILSLRTDLNEKALADAPGKYALEHPIIALASVLGALAIAYGLALAAAAFVYRGEDETNMPAVNTWEWAFLRGVPDGHLSVATVHLRDGRSIRGVVGPFRDESLQERELTLVRPIAVQAGAGAEWQEVDRQFVLLGGEDISLIEGTWHSRA